MGEVLGRGFEGWWRRLRRCVGGGWGGEGRLGMKRRLSERVHVGMGWVLGSACSCDIGESLEIDGAWC